jgi:hypothetical protein
VPRSAARRRAYWRPSIDKLNDENLVPGLLASNRQSLPATIATLSRQALLLRNIPVPVPFFSNTETSKMAHMPRDVPQPKDQKPRAQKNRELDEQIEDSFPASDPPSYSGGSHAGGPRPPNGKLNKKTR